MINQLKSLGLSHGDISKIAQLANVSQPTVQLTLRGGQGVSTAMVARVLAAMRQVKKNRQQLLDRLNPAA